MMYDALKEVRSMSTYTTGELAKLCEVTVRTVQFYDEKDLLKPTELTEGGRRLYTDEDLKKLILICLLKSLGLSLDTIKGILGSENQNKVLLLLLDEQ
jgi:DNA-binding transcriptional MerR regulator